MPHTLAENIFLYGEFILGFLTSLVCDPMRRGFAPWLADFLVSLEIQLNPSLPNFSEESLAGLLPLLFTFPLFFFFLSWTLPIVFGGR